MRQELHKLYGDAASKAGGGSGVHIHEGWTGHYEQLMGSAKFCLAPYGHGWGIRLGQVMLAGCVPVIIQVGAASCGQERVCWPGAEGLSGGGGGGEGGGE